MKFRQAYSLVELLVTMSIVGIFLAIILPSFRASAPEKTIEQASAQVQSAARTAFSRHWSSNIAGLTLTKPSKIEVWKGNPGIITATHYLPSGAVFDQLGPNPSTPSLSINFDTSKKTFYSTGNIGTDMITIKNSQSSTYATVEIDSITGVAEVKIKK